MIFLTGHIEAEKTLSISVLGLLPNEAGSILLYRIKAGVRLVLQLAQPTANTDPTILARTARVDLGETMSMSFKVCIIY